MPALTSLSSALNPQLSEKTSEVILLELDSEDHATGNSLKFQYFPESVNDTKGVNWQQKEIPGGSLPIYQWINSGERLLTFTAQFSTDIDLVAASPDPYSRLAAAGVKGRNVDIRSAVVWLRRYLLPTYGGQTDIGVPLTYAPAKVKLFMPGSGIGIAGGGPALGGDDSVLAIMTQCDVTYEQFFSNGLPRLASVNLAFAQIGQFGGAVYFPSSDDSMKEALEGNPSGTILPFGYNLYPNARGTAVIAETSAALKLVNK